MSTIKELVTRGSNSIFRRVSIKRLQINNQYEPDWGDITSYVIKFGTIRSSYNDITFLGNTNVTGATLKLDNSRGQFNDENTITSLFNGFKTRYRTKFKIEVGYLDDEQNEVEGLVFYGILYGDPTTNDNGTINIKLSSLLKVFSNYAAEGIATGAGTTEDLVDRLVKKTSDDFFESNDKTFDAIFIDGMHQSDYVLRDFNNAMDCLNDGGIIFFGKKDNGRLCRF